MFESYNLVEDWYTAQVSFQMGKYAPAAPGRKTETTEELNCDL